MHTTATGDEVVINFGDILKNLDMTAMIRGSVQKDRFFGVADVLYMSLGTSKKLDEEFPPPIRANSNLDLMPGCLILSGAII